MDIRSAKIEDAAPLAEFNIKMAMETEAIELIPEVIGAGVKAMINNPTMGFDLVAEDEANIQACTGKALAL